MQTFETSERLLLALAEQLKLPLLQIATQAELIQADPTIVATTSILQTADMAMQLIDGYLLSLSAAQTTLPLEPISVSALLQSTAERLDVVAKQYDCELRVNLAGKYAPIMGHRQSLEAALLMLGYSFIEAQPEAKDRGSRIVLAAHKSAHGLVTGIFGKNKLGGDMYRRAKVLYGNARQPLVNLAANSGAGIFIADSLLTAMHTPLHTARHNKLNGLAATLLPSQQLQLLSL